MAQYGNATDVTSEPTGRSEPVTLQGARVTLRPAREADIPALVAIRSDPEVYRWWRGGPDLAATVADELADEEARSLTIEYEDRIVGLIQWSAEEEPDYRHASIDIYLDTAVHGRGLGADAVYVVARHLIVDHGHHRITIDPAANNHAAIRCYSKVGFKPVGVMRRYERGADGTWHDGLLMDLLADELAGTTRRTDED
jgi:aminoglycoside 6'-N-acetyltransferase